MPPANPPRGEPELDATIGLDGEPVPPAPPDQTVALHESSVSADGGNARAAQPDDPSQSASDSTLPFPAPQGKGAPEATIQQPSPWSQAGGVELELTSQAGVFIDEGTVSQIDSVPELPRVAGYEILGELGRGAMGVVYKARQTGLKRIVALKMILSGGHASDTELRRFRTEAEAVARLQHPNIVQVFEIGEHKGLPFFSLEFVDGGCLADRLVDNSLAPRETALVVRQLAEAMAYAHDHGIVHRDLKPANILMTRQGVPKITDFGLAKKLEDDSGATRAGAIMGTPSYMAPEQAEGRIDLIGPKSDVYALGAILYDLLTGRPPFRGTSILETLSQVRLNDPVPPIRLQPLMPNDLQTICLKCLEKEPGKRYENARELAEDLRRFLDGEPILARPVSTWERVGKWCKRRPAAAALIAVSGLLVLSLAVGGVVIARVQHLRAVEAERLHHEAEEQRLRAEKHFLEAREAVDQMLSRVGQERLAYEPRMEQVRRDLLEQAAAFYERFLESEGPSLVVRYEAARAANKVGDIRTHLGRNLDAETSYRRAMELLEELHRDNPNNPDYRQELGATCNNLGNLLREARRFKEAEVIYSRGIELQKGLVEENPHEPRPRRELATSHYNRALMEDALGRSQQAMLSLKSALELQEKLHMEQPQDLGVGQELARSWTVLGRIQGTRQPADAERSYGEALALLGKLVHKAPRNPTIRQELLLASNQLGDLLSDGRPKDAGPLFHRAVALGEALIRDFPTVPDYQQTLAASYNSLSIWHLAAGRRNDSQTASERSLALKEKLVANFPRLPDYRRDLAKSQANLGLGLQTAGRAKEAENAYRRAIELLRSLVKEFPGSVRDEQDLALTLPRLAMLDRSIGEKGLREAMTILDRHLKSEPTSRELRAARAETGATLATFLQLAGQPTEAESFHKQAEEDYRDLVRRYSQEPQYELSLATALINRGELYRVTNRPKEAETTWSESATLLGQLAKERPRVPVYAREQARAHHNLGILFKEQKRFGDAESQHRQALAVRNQLVETYKLESAYRRELASSHAELGIVLALRNNPRASESFGEAIRILDRLHTEQPNEIGFITDLITQHGNLANLLEALGRDDEAMKHRGQAIAMKEKLVKWHEQVARTAPTEPSHRSEVARLQHELATELAQQGRRGEARSRFLDAIRQQRLAVDLAPKTDAFRALLAVHHFGLADLLLADNDHDGSFRAVLEVRSILQRDHFPVGAALLARCVTSVQADKKLPEEKRKEIAKEYGDRSIELLRKAFATGFSDVKALREAREFEGLRDRDDFKKLIAAEK